MERLLRDWETGYVVIRGRQMDGWRTTVQIEGRAVEVRIIAVLEPGREFVWGLRDTETEEVLCSGLAATLAGAVLAAQMEVTAFAFAA